MVSTHFANRGARVRSALELRQISEGTPSSADGAIDAPTAIVVRLEAEAGRLTAPFTIGTDPEALSGMYLLDGALDGSSGAGEASFEFTVVATATYYVWGRARATTTANDSFWLSIDGGTENSFVTTCVHDGVWRWTFAATSACPVASPRPFMLSPGAHTLRLGSREGQSVMDQIIITDDISFVPGDS